MNMTSCPKTTDSKYPSFQSFFTLSYCKTNRMYVILLWDVNLWYEIWQKEVSGIVFFFLIHDVNSMLKGSEWYWPLCYRSSWTHSVVLQIVSDVASFMKSSEIHLFLWTQEVSSVMSWWFHSKDSDLIKILPMANSMWVTLCKYFWKAVLCIFFWKWLTGCKQHWRFFWKAVSSHLTSFPMSNREWVTLHILWKAVSSHLFLWPTASEWHYTFCERQSHHIFSYDQQRVSDIGHFVKGSLITSFPMTNSLWVTLYILWKAVSWSSHHFLWPTACEWHYTFCERQSHDHHIFSYDQQPVSDIANFVKGSLITSFPMTNRLWVTLHILWKAVSSHLFLWPTGSEWHCTFCERQSHHIFSYDQ